MPKDTPPAAGHNRQIEIDEDRFLHYLASHSTLDEKIDALKTQRKTMRKEMQADGIRLGEFDVMRKFQAMNRVDVEDHFVHLKHYMTWVRHPIGHQFDLMLPPGPEGDFENEDVVLAKAGELATQDGFWAGLCDKPMGDNPHEPNGAAGQAWISAWHDGQKRREHESVDLPDVAA